MWDLTPIWSFNSEEEAITWLMSAVDEPGMRHTRVGYKDDSLSMLKYNLTKDTTARDGKQRDEEVIIKGRTAYVGINY